MSILPHSYSLPNPNHYDPAFDDAPTPQDWAEFAAWLAEADEHADADPYEPSADDWSALRTPYGDEDGPDIHTAMTVSEFEYQCAEWETFAADAEGGARC